MKKAFILLALCISLTFCKSNLSHNLKRDVNAKREINYIPYYLKMYEADSLLLSGNLEKSQIILDSLFLNFKPINLTLYFEYENYIKSSIILNLKRKYTSEISNLIVNYGYSYNDITTDSLLNIALQKSGITESKADKLHLNYIKKIDTTFRKKVNEIYTKDQTIRNTSYKTEKLKLDAIEKTDRHNDSILRKYISLNGYPGDSKIGTFRKLYNDDEFKGGIDVLLIHHKTSHEFYKDKLLEFVRNGTCNPRDLALLTDTWHINKHGESYYFIMNLSGDDWLNDSNKVKIINQRRKSIGLPSVAQEKYWFKKRILNH